MGADDGSDAAAGMIAAPRTVTVKFGPGVAAGFGAGKEADAAELGVVTLAAATSALDGAACTPEDAKLFGSAALVDLSRSEDRMIVTAYDMSRHETKKANLMTNL